MESRRKRTQRDYTLAFKLSAVEQAEKGEWTYKQAQAKYGIHGRRQQTRERRANGDQPAARGVGVCEDGARHPGKSNGYFAKAST